MPLGLGCQERRGFVKHLDNPRAGVGPLKHHLRRRSASPWAEPTCRRRAGPPPVARRPYTRLRFYRISACPCSSASSERFSHLLREPALTCETTPMLFCPISDIMSSSCRRTAQIESETQT